MNEYALETIKRHEGLRLFPYLDTVGKSTIGYGRNLDDVGISQYEAEMLLMNDIKKAKDDAKAIFNNFHKLSERRQAVLINMSFNLGRSRLSGFKRMIAAVESDRYADAVAEMMDSKWAVQVGIRANELAEMMRNG